MTNIVIAVITVALMAGVIVVGLLRTYGGGRKMTIVDYPELPAPQQFAEAKTEEQKTLQA